jgi:hypothetical protein
MDEDRQIRFLIPPFFLYASLLWWAFIDPYLQCSLAALTGDSLKEMVAIVAAGGAATIPLGFSIGTLGVFILTGLLRSGFPWWKPRPKERQIYEAWVSKECFSSILLVTKAPDYPWNDSRPSLLSAVATFDHELLPKGIHEWLRRRFNAFIVASNSALAILISFLIVGVRGRFYARSFDRYCGLSERQLEQQASWGESKCWWLAVTVALVALFFWAAWKSWRETMDMIEFQSKRTNVDELRERKKRTE